MARNDNILEKKWSQKRVMYTDLSPFQDPGIDFSNDPGYTDQSQASEADINNILKKYQQTGILPGVNAEALYKDVSDATSYHEAMDIVINAQNQFDSLDAHLRKKFDNDPAQFMEFIHNPENGEEAVKLGLAAILPKTPSEAIVEAISSLKTPSEASPKAAAGSRKPSEN